MNVDVVCMTVEILSSHTILPQWHCHCGCESTENENHTSLIPNCFGLLSLKNFEPCLRLNSSTTEGYSTFISNVFSNVSLRSRWSFSESQKSQMSTIILSPINSLCRLPYSQCSAREYSDMIKVATDSFDSWTRLLNFAHSKTKHFLTVK